MKLKITFKKESELTDATIEVKDPIELFSQLSNDSIMIYPTSIGGIETTVMYVKSGVLIFKPEHVLHIGSEFEFI